MKVEYIRELRNSYMQIMGETGEVDYQMKMMESNEPSGFLKLSLRNINDETRYLYNISSLSSMEDIFLKKEMVWSDLEKIMNSFSIMFSSIEKYLIDYNGIVLKPEMIFCDSSGQWLFAYYSDKKTSFEEDMKKLFEYIIQHVNHRDTRAVTVAYGIYKRVCEENINPDKLFEIEVVEKENVYKDDRHKEDRYNEDRYEVIKERKVVEAVLPEMVTEETEEQDEFKILMVYGIAGIYILAAVYFIIGIFVKAIRVVGCGSIVYAVIAVLMGVIGFKGFKWYNKNKKLFVKIKKREIEIPFEKERIRIFVPPKEIRTSSEDMTMLLDDDEDLNKHFIKWSDSYGKREYELINDVTIIGSSSDRADCVILQKGISRVHAKISNEDGKFYLKDMNSTNGTMVNGRMLSCYEICEIKDGDKIQLGNMECIFV